MNVADLMIGDWVNLDDSPFKINMDDLGFIERDETYGKGVRCKPIPLTEEMLEKNGIKPDDYSGGSYRIIEGMSFCIDISTDGCSLSAGYNQQEDINIYIGIRYVHELQHALKLWGIEKEIVL